MKEFRLYALLISVGAVSASLPASSATMLTAKQWHDPIRLRQRR